MKWFNWGNYQNNYPKQYFSSIIKLNISSYFGGDKFCPSFDRCQTLLSPNIMK